MDPEVINLSNAPMLYSPSQVARILGLSRTKTYDLLSSGAIPSVKIGRSRRVPARLLNDYIESLSDGR